MTTNHTPGPWKKVFINGHWHIAREDGRVEVAKVSAYKTREVSDANAALIESAPDLLSALELAEATIQRLAPDGSRATQGTRDVISAALKLAERQ